MNKSDEQQLTWVDFLALGFSFFAMIFTIWAVISVAYYQTRDFGGSLWPLPGLVLVVWALWVLSGFIASYLCMRRTSVKWLQAIWFITGTFIPLFILGALSIGVAVFIVFLLFLISTIILSIRQRAKWLKSIGMLLLGGVGNLVILLIIIALGNSYYS